MQFRLLSTMVAFQLFPSSAHMQQWRMTVVFLEGKNERKNFGMKTICISLLPLVKSTSKQLYNHHINPASRIVTHEICDGVTNCLQPVMDAFHATLRNCQPCLKLSIFESHYILQLQGEEVIMIFFKFIFLVMVVGVAAFQSARGIEIKPVRSSNKKKPWSRQVL